MVGEALCSCYRVKNCRDMIKHQFTRSKLIQTKYSASDSKDSQNWINLHMQGLKLRHGFRRISELKKIENTPFHLQGKAIATRICIISTVNYLNGQHICKIPGHTSSTPHRPVSSCLQTPARIGWIMPCSIPYRPRAHSAPSPVDQPADKASTSRSLTVSGIANQNAHVPRLRLFKGVPCRSAYIPFGV